MWNISIYMLIFGIFILKMLNLIIYYKYERNRLKPNIILTHTYTGKYKYLLNDSCIFCLEDFKDGDQNSVFKSCGHVFHTYCIIKWIKKRSCPCCRSKNMSGVIKGE